MTDLSFVKAIEKGVESLTPFILPNGSKVMLRPLSDWEIDEVDMKVESQLFDRKTRDYMYRARSGSLGDITDEQLNNVDFDALRMARKSRIYWIFLASTHESYNDLSFDKESLEVVKKVIGVKKAVLEILRLSGRTAEARETAKSFRDKSAPDKPPS